jgi:hypothetical protein
MADHVTLSAGSGGDTVAADDVSGVKYQLVQLVKGSDGGAKTLITGTDALPVDVIAALPAGTNTIGKVQPFAAVLEGGLTELIGVNEQVDQNEYSDEVGVALGGTYSGEVLAVTLYSTEDGSGAVQTPAGKLLLFDADPATSAGDSTVSAAAWVTLLGVVSFASSDWVGDANGKVAHKTVALPFHALSTLYFVFRNEGSSFNDAAGDDEQLEVNFWYRRDS